MTQSRIFKTMFGAAFASLLSTPVMALSDQEVTALDFNKNGQIDRGAELQALLNNRSALNARQLTYAEEARENEAIALILLTDLVEQEDGVSCTTEKRFYLRETALSSHLLLPSGPAVSANGAKLAFKRDNITDTSTWNAEGVLLWHPGSAGRCLAKDRTKPVTRATLSGFAVAPYVEFDGSGSDLGNDPSRLAFGVHLEMQTFGGIFNFQHYTLNPYVQTDFQGKSRVAGVSASWTPYHIGASINGTKTQGGPFAAWWILAADADFKSINAAGNSGLTANTKYAWLGAKIGGRVQFKPPKSNGYYFQASMHASRDLRNDMSANLGEVKFGLHLNPSQTASVEVTYLKGIKRQTLERKDDLEMTLRFSF